MSLPGKSRFCLALRHAHALSRLSCLLVMAGCVGSGGEPPPVGSGPADAQAPDATSHEAGAAHDAATSDATAEAASGPTTPATASLSAAAIDFGGVNCGVSPPPSKALTVTNTGGSTLAVSATVLGSTFTFASGSATTLTLAAGASGTLTLEATVPASATAGTPLTGSLALFTNDPTGPDRAIPLQVTPTGATLSGTSTYVFPATAIDVASTPVALQLTNSGNASATYGVGTLSNSEFSISGVASGGITLAAGASWSGTATFTPSATSTQTGTASVTATSGATCGSGVSQLGFNGAGTEADLSGWPSNNSLDFGSVDCGGSAPASQTITLVNNSSDVVAHITSVDTSQANGFGVSVAASTPIAAGGTLAITVTAPAVAATSSLNTISGTIVLGTDASPSTLTLTLTEEPQGAILAFQTSSQTFGSFGTVILLQSGSQSFSVVNNGNASANVSLSATENAASDDSDAGAEAGADAEALGDGGSASPFELSTPSFALGADSTEQDSVTFRPLHANATVGALAMGVASSTVLCAPLPAALPLSGSAIGGGPDVTPMALAFAATCGGAAPASQTVFVVNDGTVDLNWTMTGVSGPGESEFTVTSSPAPGLLIPGAFATITVKAVAVPSPAPHPNPAENTAQVTITTDVPYDPPHVISLSEVPLGDQLSVSTSDLRFGQIPLNTSISQTFTVSNNANAGSPAATVSLSPGNSAYTVQSGGTIAAGGSATETVSFDPTAAQGDVSSLSFTTSDALCTPLPAAIVLSGTGTAGSLSLSATTLTFGTNPSDPNGLVACGSTGTTQTLSLSNVGTQALNVETATLGKGASSPFSLSGPGATLPLLIGIGGSSSITITPAAIPQAVADPNDPSAFSDVLTITTDATNDTPHTVTLTMQPYGTVIASTPFHSTWSFGTVGAGSIGTFSNTIQNTGNATASVALKDLTLPQIFGLANNPTAAAANAVTELVGQFTPPSENGTWSDQGELVVSAPAFCEPLPTQWDKPTVNLSGSSTAKPVVTLTGTLTFPTTNCGSSAPAGQAITLTNQTNQSFAFTARFNSGTFYTAAIGNVVVGGGDASATDAGGATTVADAGSFGVTGDGGSLAGSGTILANGVTVIVVTPTTITPGPAVAAGSAPYADDLIISIASTPPASFTIPISWALNGAVLSLPEGLGTNTDSNGALFYPADSQSGFALPMVNTGTGTATVSFGVQPTGAFSFSPSPPITVEPGIRALPVLTSGASDAKCPSLTSGSVTFLYSGPVCQPFPYSQVKIESCVGTY